MEEAKKERELKFEHFYCSGCNGLLFTDKELVFHAPVFMSSFMPKDIMIMEGNTSDVAINSIKLQRLQDQMSAEPKGNFSVPSFLMQ